VKRKPEIESLRPPPDPAILAIARALARSAAREDHAKAMQAAEMQGSETGDETRSDLRPLFD
jgi:hypothetical protein